MMSTAQESEEVDTDVTVSLLDVTDIGIRFRRNQRKKKTENKDEVKSPGLFGIFRYGQKFDITLMLVGLVFSIITGASMPCLGLIFGDMTNVFMIVTKRGFKNSTLALNDSQSSNDIFSNSTSNNTGFEENFMTLEEFLNYMNRYSLYYLYIAIATLIASFLQTLCWELASERQVQRLRRIYFSQVLRQDVAWFDEHKQGDLNTRLSDDLERIREGIGNKFAMVAQYSTTFISGILVGLYADWILTLALMVAGPLIVGTAGFIAKVTAGSAEREQLKYSLASGVAVEVMSCLRTVTAFGGEKREVERYGNAIYDGSKLAMKKYDAMSLGLFFMQFIIYSTYGCGFYTACYLIREGYSTPGGVFTVFFSVMMGAFTLGSVFPFINSLSTAAGAAKNVFHIIDRIPLIDPYSKAGIIPDHLDGQITFQSVLFAYPTRSEVQVLSGLSMKIKPGQTVAIVGSSGAGKSTIVNLLMRFYDYTAGLIAIDGENIRDLNLEWLRNNIGLVSQEPVLFGVSILENIKYGRKDVTIEEIKAAASLANTHSFIKDLPKGYDTLVGDRGAQLSGGQKQRIAIARALVRCPKILLLDEATSALDSQSEGVVQEALENAMRGRTTIIIAHRLSTIRNADLIYVMKDGKIVESGKHDELMALNRIYYHLVNTQINEDMKNEVFLKAERREFINGAELNGFEHTSKANNEEENQASEEVEKRYSVVGRLLKLNAPEWYWLLMGCILICIAGATQPIFAFFYAEVFSTFSLEGDEMEWNRNFWTIMFIILGLVSGGSYWGWVFTMASAAEVLIARVRLLAMENVLKQEISWFDNSSHSSGKIVTQLARDAPVVKHVAGLRIGQVLSAVVGFLTALAIAFIYGWKLALMLLAIVPIVIYGGFQQVKISRKNIRRDLNLMDDAGKIASECIQNLRTVQALGRESEFTELYMEYLQVPYKESKKQAFLYSIMFALSTGFAYLMYSAAFKYGSILIANKEMVPSDVYRVLFALTFSALAIGQGAAYLQDFSKGIMSSKAMFYLIDKQSKADPLDSRGLKPPVSGKVRFHNVCFSYPTRKDIQILHRFNLEVEAGQTVALVGESGCGKSTVISLLEGFYTLDTGEILVDNIDTRNINLKYLRSQIGLVTQEPVLFNCTIKENILYGIMGQKKVPTHQQVIEAAKMANAHEFISHLPLGYETLCGERGAQLSGGQKQRIAIARALIRNPKILLLDEATSALDNENEKIVQEALDKARSGRTCIIVAHRLSTIQNADKIAVILKGRVVELGTHEELKARHGIYYQLIKRQQL